MNILLLGSGGRESALAHSLSRSKLCTQLFIAPGNAGTPIYGQNIALNTTDFEALKTFCLDQKIDLLLPGNEDPLVAGIWDFFKNDELLKQIIVCGPSKEGAQLEGSKSFSKKFMQRHNIPTAAYKEFDLSNFEEGLIYLQNHSLPVVLKADGLAAGKGVVIAKTTEEAISSFTDMIKNQQFGEASKRVVVEAFLTGIELSVFILSDGENYVILPEAKDYKRIGSGDTGPNTGGMGAISPVPFATPDFMKKVIESIIEPTVAGLKAEKITYQGFLFFGLINVDGEPFVIEYNCRMGDPETEVVMPRILNDLVDLIVKMDTRSLNEAVIKTKQEVAATVMLVSQGYPNAYEKGKRIDFIDEVKDCTIYHAGSIEKEGLIYTNGGRVLSITALAIKLEVALRLAYENAARINFEGKTYRRDIGFEFVGEN